MSVTRAERNRIRVERYKSANVGIDPYVGDPKECYRCKESLALKFYAIDRTKRDSLQSYCKKCARRQMIEFRYGIKYEKYESLLEIQGFRCAICRVVEHSESKPLPVDHSHVSNVVRGLLCSECNKGLGNFKDEPRLLLSAIAYLEGRDV